MILNQPAPNSTLRTDVAVIGAGPTGLFAVFQAGMLKMSAHVFDSLEIIGGQCAALYPLKPIFDIPAYPMITGAELIKQLAAQAAPFKPHFHLGQPVIAVDQDASGFLVKTASGTAVHAKAVVISAGSGVFSPTRPALPKIEEYEGASVFYSVTAPEDFRGKRVVIAGGGDSAVDWALLLSDFASQVYVVHRRDRFKAAPESVSRLRQLAAAKKVELVVPYQLRGLHGMNGLLEAVEVATMEGDARFLEADILVPLFGLATNIGPIQEWGLKIRNGDIIVEPGTCETNIPGIYAIGDIAEYSGKLKLILSGFAEAASAMHAAYKRVYPDQPLHWEHSTTKGVPLSSAT